MADLDGAFAALADPRRREVVRLLGEGPRRSSDLADALEISRPAMSRHLRVLRRAGIVQQELSETDGRERVLTLRREPFAALRGWVDEVEAFWTDQLESFRRHAERKRRDR